MHSTNKPLIAITGANGFLGNAIVRHFAARDYRVLALVRYLPFAQDAVPGVTYRRYDLLKTLDENEFDGVDYFVHCAYTRRESRYQGLEVNRFSCEEILRLNQKRPFKKLIYLSSVQATKSAPSFYGRMKFETERLFNKENMVVLKAGMVVGDGGIVRLVRRIVNISPVIPLIEKGEQKIYYVGLNDFLSVVEKCTQSDVHGEIVLCQPKPVLFKDIVVAVDPQKVPRFLMIPGWVLSLVYQIARLFTGGRLGLLDQVVNLRNELGILKTSDLSDLEVKEKDFSQVMEENK
jgi:nucleoside-diphosphate-sugar epimerase